MAEIEAEGGRGKNGERVKKGVYKWRTRRGKRNAVK